MLLLIFAIVSVALSAGICLAGGLFEGLGWLWALPLMAAGGWLVLVILAFLFLLYLCSRVDQEKEQECDDPFYRKVTELYLDSILPAVRVHVKSRGMEKIPKEGRFMLVCNHTNNSDPIILMDRFRGHQLAFISKKENKDMFVIGKMMHKLLCQLIDRENDRAALKTIIKCIQILKDDKASIAVFPEGGIDDDGKLHHFRSGVFKIAQKANVPIVVCTLKNTGVVVHNLARFKRSDVELNLLEVIPAEELKGVSTTQIAERVHKLMADDLGPDLVAED